MQMQCSNHHPSLSTLRSKGLSLSKMKWWAIFSDYPILGVEVARVRKYTLYFIVIWHCYLILKSGSFSKWSLKVPYFEKCCPFKKKACGGPRMFVCLKTLCSILEKQIYCSDIKSFSEIILSIYLRAFFKKFYHQLS